MILTSLISFGAYGINTFVVRLHKLRRLFTAFGYYRIKVIHCSPAWGKEYGKFDILRVELLKETNSKGIRHSLLSNHKIALTQREKNNF
jgi:hypothetical protein